MSDCWLYLGFGATAPSGTLGCSTAPFGGAGLGLNLGGLGSTGASLFQQPQAKPATTGLGFTGNDADHAPLLSVSL